MKEPVFIESDNASQLVDLLGKVKRDNQTNSNGNLKSLRARTLDRIPARSDDYFGTGLALPTHIDSFDTRNPLRIANPECEWIGRDNEVVLEREELNGHWLITSGAQRCIPSPCPRTIDSFTFQSTRSLVDIFRDGNGNVTGFGAPVGTYDFNTTISDIKPLSIAPWQEWHEGCTNVVSRNVSETSYGTTTCEVRHAQPVRDFQFAIELPGTAPTIENPSGIVAAVFELVQCTPITARLFLQEEIVGRRNQTQIFVWDDERYIVSTMTWRYKCTTINLNFAPGGACRTTEEIASAVQTQIRSLGTTHPELATAVVTVDMTEKPICDPLWSESITVTQPDTCLERNITEQHDLVIYGRIYRLEALGSQIRFSVWQYSVSTLTRIHEGCDADVSLFQNCCEGGNGEWTGDYIANVTVTGGWSQIYFQTIDCSEPSTYIQRVRGRTYRFPRFYQFYLQSFPRQEVNLVNQFRLVFEEPVTWPSEPKFPAILKPWSAGVELAEIGAVQFRRNSWTVTLDCDAEEPNTFPVFSTLPFGNITRRLKSRINGGRLTPDSGWQWNQICNTTPCDYRSEATIANEPLTRLYAGITHPIDYLAGTYFEGHISGGDVFTIAYPFRMEGYFQLAFCSGQWSIRGLIRWALYSRFWRTSQLQLLHDTRDIWDFDRFEQPDLFVSNDYNLNIPVTESNFWSEHNLSPLRQWAVSLDGNGIPVLADLPASFQFIPRS